MSIGLAAPAPTTAGTPRPGSIALCDAAKDAVTMAVAACPAAGRIDPKQPERGLIAKGHPIGATAVAQMAEIYWQLRGEAGGRQVGEPQIGLTHNVGGNGQVCCVNIARRVLTWPSALISWSAQERWPSSHLMCMLAR